MTYFAFRRVPRSDPSQVETIERLYAPALSDTRAPSSRPISAWESPRASRRLAGPVMARSAVDVGLKVFEISATFLGAVRLRRMVHLRAFVIGQWLGCP